MALHTRQTASTVFAQGWGKKGQLLLLLSPADCPVVKKVSLIFGQWNDEPSR